MGFGGVDSGGHEAANAVARDNDGAGINAVSCDGGGLLKILQGVPGVFGGVGEGEAAGAAPTAAIMEGQDIPSGAAGGLGKVQILLVAGEAVEEEPRRVQAGTGGGVEDRVERPVFGGHGGGGQTGGVGGGGQRGDGD